MASRAYLSNRGHFNPAYLNGQYRTVRQAIEARSEAAVVEAFFLIHENEPETVGNAHTAKAGQVALIETLGQFVNLEGL